MSNTAALAGSRAGRTRTPVDILDDTKYVKYEAGVIDGTYSYNGAGGNFPYEFQAGTFMGRLAGGKWIPLKLTRADGAGTDATSLVVDDARFFKVGDTITVGEDTGVEITAIDYDTQTLTIASSTWADRDYIAADGDLAGAGVPKAILNEWVTLEDADTRDVADRKVWNLLVFGFVIDDKLQGDSASAIAYARANNLLRFIGFEQDLE